LARVCAFSGRWFHMDTLKKLKLQLCKTPFSS
jgi:hypothetical protein